MTGPLQGDVGMRPDQAICGFLDRAFLEPSVAVEMLAVIPEQMVRSLPRIFRIAFDLVANDIRKYGKADFKRVIAHADGDGEEVKWLLSEIIGDAKPLPDLLANFHQAIYHPPTPPGKLGTFKPTDLWNAMLLVHLFGDRVRFCDRLGGWLIYDGKRWYRAECGEAERFAKETVLHIYQLVLAEKDENRRQEMAKYAARSESAGKIKALLELARTEDRVAVSPEAFNADPWELNVANGTIDLRTGLLRAHRPGDLISNIVDVVYDPNATCPTWEKFLDSTTGVNRELIPFLQRACGYSLSGITREQCFFFLYGPEAAGKSTFIRVIQNVMGTYALTAEIQTFTVRRDGGARNDLARLAGARLVTATEPGEAQTFDEILIRQLTGQDVVSARFLFKEHFEFSPTFKIWLAGNHRPRIRATGGAMWRRIHVIPFTRTVPEVERDGQLFEKLIAEKEGILAWMVRGCRNWQGKDLGVPDAVRAATGEYRKAEDVIAPFIEECCVVGNGERVAKGILYKTYQQWCEGAGEKTISQKAFGIRLEEKGFDEFRDKKTRYWLGIGVREER
jgi:putative DNA primase/helicase